MLNTPNDIVNANFPLNLSPYDPPVRLVAFKRFQAIEEHYDHVGHTTEDACRSRKRNVWKEKKKILFQTPVDHGSEARKISILLTPIAKAYNLFINYEHYVTPNLFATCLPYHASTLNSALVYNL